MASAVFLDRDGVLNRAIVVNGVPHPPHGLDQLQILPGVTAACARLREAGLKLIVVTNQPDIARGTQRRETVDALNRAINDAVGYHDLFMCIHDDRDRCDCRKPRPGMLLAAAAKHHIDLSRSVMVGDRDRDVMAGQAAGCRTVFVNQGYGAMPNPAADLTTDSLHSAADWIISHTVSSEDDINDHR